jgi:hypothetical protein
MTKAELVNLLEQCPDDAIIMIVPDTDYLPDAREADVVMIEKSTRVRFCPPRDAEQQQTVTIYLSTE